MTKTTNTKTITKVFHICYLIGNELCTGINLEAENYIHAIVEFQDKYKDKKIIYVTEKYAL